MLFKYSQFILLAPYVLSLNILFYKKINYNNKFLFFFEYIIKICFLLIFEQIFII